MVGHGVINMSLEITTARPEDNALNIQYRHPLSRTNAGGPHTSISPIDDSSPLSEIDYAEHIATNYNMDVKKSNPSPPSINNARQYSFSLPLSNPCAPSRWCCKTLATMT